MRTRDRIIELHKRDLPNSEIARAVGVSRQRVWEVLSPKEKDMKERARFWGNEVKISGIPGKGTVVTVSLPLKNGEDSNAENINS